MPRRELGPGAGVCFSQRSPVFSAVVGVRPRMSYVELEEAAWCSEKDIGSSLMRSGLTVLGSNYSGTSLL